MLAAVHISRQMTNNRRRAEQLANAGPRRASTFHASRANSLIQNAARRRAVGRQILYGSEASLHRRIARDAERAFDDDIDD